LEIDIEDEGLVKILKFIQPDANVALTLPCRQVLSVAVARKAAVARALLVQKIATKCQHYCITTDIWSSRSMNAYLGVTLHYVTNDFDMVSCTLEVKALPGKHTGDAIAAAMETVLSDWGLQKKI
jgi:hypothetical protein